MAYVLQSDAGASAVIGSNMVLADTCSWVDGSNRITSPLVLPIGGILADYLGKGHKGVVSTKSYVPVPHPSRDLQWLKGGKSSMLATSEQVPDNGRLAIVIGDHEPSSPPLAHIIHRYELDVFTMMRESSLDGKSVVV
jgi:hypothetical protein